MRVLWAKAPLVLLRHPAVLLAIVAASALVGLAAASAPFIRAGVASESLKAQVRTMSPLAAGLEIRTGGPLARDESRRAGAVELARALPYLGAPVLTSELPAVVAGADGSGLQVVAMSRTDAVAHVGHVAGDDPDGVWISEGTAQATHLRPGRVLRLTEYGGGPGTATPPVVSLRVAGVYRSLDGDLGNPYWVNFVQDIRPVAPDGPLPPAFVLMPHRTLARVARTLSPYVENRFEYPIDPTRLTLAGARSLERRFAAIAAELAARSSPLGRSLGCGVRVAATIRVSCSATSSLSPALAVAGSDVAAVSPTISLLADCGVLIALVAVAAAGAFGVRRRGGEAELLYARGEATASFAARAALEALLPAVLGVAAGVGAALLALRAFTPAGTIDRGTVVAGVEQAAVAAAIGLAAFALGAAVLYPRRRDHAHPWLRRLRRLPWELLPLGAGGALLGVLLTGGGLSDTASGSSHPRLEVFVVPVLIAAGAAGLAVRAGRALIARRAGSAPAPVFLAARRLGAARALLVAVVVAAAAAFAAFVYAATLSSSLARGAGEKAFVANGSDVQGVVDPREHVTTPFSFPVALVQVDSYGVSLDGGGRVDLIAGDPAAMARTIRWGADWPDDPRAELPRLAASDGPPLLALATPDVPAVDAIWSQGARLPVRIVGRVAAFPGTTAGRPALVVSSAALRRAAARAKIADPAPMASGLLWAKGDPAVIEPALRRSSLAPAYLTTADNLRRNPSVVAAGRTYGFFRTIGIATAVLSLVALLLYLQARQRGQLIASALVRRMGLRPVGDAAALALEAAAIVLLACAVGAATALATAKPLVHHVDPLPQYAPVVPLVAPWSAVVLALVAATVAAGAAGAAAAVLAARSNVAEALRVA